MRKAKRKADKFIKIDHSKSDKDQCRGESASVLYILESDFHDDQVYRIMHDHSHVMRIFKEDE